MAWTPFAKATGTQSREVELRDGGRITHLREDSGPLRDEHGNVVGRLYAYHDLSWEKTIDQMKSEFISIASHELRTPMTSIKGSVDLILSGSNGERQYEEAHDLLEVAQSGWRPDDPANQQYPGPIENRGRTNTVAGLSARI